MNKLNRLAAATGALALALSVGAAWANEKDRQPTTSTPTTQSKPSTTPPSSTTSTPPASSSTTSSSTTSAGTSSTTAATSSGQAVGRPFVQFKDLDANSDMSISADELSANTSVSIDLALYDSNKDGKLSESEYARYKNQMARNNPDKDDTMPEKR